MFSIIIHSIVTVIFHIVTVIVVSHCHSFLGLLCCICFYFLFFLKKKINYEIARLRTYFD
jgi:hypothetical protein